MTLDLQKILSKIGLDIQTELEDNVRDQKSLDGSAYSPPAQSTIAGRRKSGISSTFRLIVSGSFWRNAFQFKVANNILSIFGNRATHPSGSISYEDIIAQNNRNSPDANRKVAASDRPLIFPNNEQEFLLMKSSKTMIKDLEQEIAKQIESQLQQELPKKIEIKINI